MLTYDPVLAAEGAALVRAFFAEWSIFFRFVGCGTQTTKKNRHWKMGPALQPQDRKAFLALVAVNLPGHDMEGGRWCSRFLSKCCVSYQASACTGSLDLLAARLFPVHIPEVVSFS